MKITGLHLKNFKRFSDLRIADIPENTNLVLLIGPNGSGKSSIFDSFSFAEGRSNNEFHWAEATHKLYFRKNMDNSVEVTIEYQQNNVSSNMIFKDDEDLSRTHPKRSSEFYGRTSFRHIPRLTRTALGQGANLDSQKLTDRPQFFIDRDERFENDLEKLTERILKDLFSRRKSGDEIYKKYIQPINNGLNRIFGGENGTKLELIEIIPPLEGKVAQLTFRKGISEFHYNYLSAGEKEIFNLLVNLMSRSSLYPSAIYYLDELDLHLNTALQTNLLKEIVENWIPSDSQLWTASHSLGFIEYAKQSKNAVIIDLGNYNFDFQRVLTPLPKENADIYEIAVGKAYLPSLFRHLDIYFVENQDSVYYACANLPQTLFISDPNRDSIYHKVRIPDTTLKGIVDRDFLTDEEIQLIENQYFKLRILRYYSIENYLYHPDNLESYHRKKMADFDRQLYITALTQGKNLIKDHLLLDVKSKRSSYPYFGETAFNGKPVQNRFRNKAEHLEQSKWIKQALDSDNFETFYKSLPMKNYCTDLTQRKHIPKTELARTDWFAQQFKKILK